jgi:hypothetical protein
MCPWTGNTSSRSSWTNPERAASSGSAKSIIPT